MRYILKFGILFISIISIYGCQKNDKTTSKKIVANYDDIWYLSTDTDKTKNVEIFVKEVGVGDTIVIVHGGFGAEHSYLLDLFDGLEDEFHFVYYDQRGSLRSPATDSLITAMAHVEDLEKLRQELNIKKLNIFGHSMGTWVASAYLNKYPNHVKQMTLLGLVWPKLDMTDEEIEISNNSDDAFSEFVQRKEIQDILKKEGFDTIQGSSKVESYKWQIKFASGSIYDISKWRNMKGGWAFFNQKASTAAGSTMPENYNWIQAYKENPQIQITVINGSHDLVDFGGALHKKWLDPLPNVSYHLVDKAGHNSWIDQPIKINELLYKSLK
jgi:pimeloyl-ACP methyl ester carboxylesterase